MKNAYCLFMQGLQRNGLFGKDVIHCFQPKYEITRADVVATVLDNASVTGAADWAWTVRIGREGRLWEFRGRKPYLLDWVEAWDKQQLTTLHGAMKLSPIEISLLEAAEIPANAWVVKGFATDGSNQWSDPEPLQ